MIDGGFLKQLDKLSLIINKKVTSNFVGNRATRNVGSGLVFGDYATYSLGDDFRSIDWKVYARSGKLYVKRYEEDKNLTVHVVLDFSASMGFHKKSEYASKLGLGFVYLAIKNNERYVLSTFSENLEFFRPSKGGKQIAGIVDYLNNRKASGKTDLWTSMANYKSLVNTVSMVVVISDFFYDISQVKDVLAKYKGNDIRLIQVLDPLERDMHLQGNYKLKDLESGDKLRAYITPALRSKYIDRMQAHSNEIMKLCESVRARFTTISTDEDIFDVFYKVLV